MERERERERDRDRDRDKESERERETWRERERERERDPQDCQLDAPVQDGLSFCESITGEREVPRVERLRLVYRQRLPVRVLLRGLASARPALQERLRGDDEEHCDYGWEAGSGQAVPPPAAPPSSSVVPAAAPISAHRFKVNVENRCHVAIWVAAQYIHMDDGEWRAEGWWKLDPGEKAYILDTDNRYLYLYATDQGRPHGVDGRLLGLPDGSSTQPRR